MSNPRAVILRATGLTCAAVLMTGCAIFSPVQTDLPYVQADGLRLSIPGMEFRNLVVVVDKQGGEGVLVGQALNRGKTSVEATFGIEDGTTPQTITIPPTTGDGITAIPSTVDVGPVPAPPGAMVSVIVTTREAGRNVVLLPVLPPDGVYEGIKPG
ncbi:MAG: hypothetical protein ABIU87_01560 [Ornithinibacter sp.]